MQISKVNGALASSFMVKNLPASLYHADVEVQSCSLLKPILESPADYKSQFVRIPKGSNEPKEFGQLFHLLLLEPHLFHSQYAIYSGSGNRSTVEYKEFAALHPGMAIIDESTLYEARHLADKTMHSKFRGRYFGDYLSEGEKEVCIYYTDPATGVKCRVRIDLMHPEFTFDPKTTAYADERKWRNHARELSYDMQSYMYSLAIALFYGSETPPPFVFVAANTEPPHSVSFRPAMNSFMTEGERKYNEAISAFAACSKVNHWPDLSNESPLELEYWQSTSSPAPWRQALQTAAA